MLIISMVGFGKGETLAEAEGNYKVEGSGKPRLEYYLNKSIPFNESEHQKAYIYGNAFLKGLEANTFSPDFTDCYNGILQFAFLELPMMSIRMHYGNTNDNIFNTTKLVKKVTQHLSVCVSMVEGL